MQMKIITNDETRAARGGNRSVILRIPSRSIGRHVRRSLSFVRFIPTLLLLSRVMGDGEFLRRIYASVAFRMGMVF